MKIRNFLQTATMLLLLTSVTETIQAQFCTSLTTLTNVSDTIKDGSGSANYANNTTCSWLIQPTGNPASITFTMDSIDLTFFNDIVSVYDGTSAAGTLVAIYRGNNLGNTAIANSGSMFVEFTTDGFANAQGWSASYTSASSNCLPNTILTANNSAFTDGTRNGFNYTNNTNCEWLIQPTAPGVFVEATFSRFAVAGGDSVILYDGSNASAPILATLTGNVNPGIYQSTGGDLFVRFVTNAIGTANGWRIVYNTQPIPFCSGTTNLTSPNGLFNDGSFPFTNYIENSNCQWLIQPPGAVTVDLQFNYFSTEANFDFVSVYQGTSNNGVLLGTFSGNNIPPALTSTTGAMFIEFTSDGLVNATGWEGSYTSSTMANISASVDTIYLNAGAGSRNTFQLTANASWTSTDNQSWLFSSPVNGTGNQTINLLAIQANIGPERAANLFINAAAGTGGDTVVVIQRSSGRFIEITDDTLFFPATNAASQNFNLLANVTWTNSISDPWISSTPINGNNNSTPQVSVTDNPTNQIRRGYIVTSGTQNAGNDTVFIVQDSLQQSFSVSPKNISLNYSSGSSDSILVQANLNWNLINTASWISTSTLSGNDSMYVIITSNSANLALADRSTTIYFDAGNGQFTDSVIVTQQFLPQNFSVTPDSIFLSSLTGSSGSVTINTNTNWSIRNAIPWISVSSQSGSDTSIIVITTTSSPATTSNRSAYIYINSVNGAFQDSVFVQQNGIPPFLNGSPNVVTVSMSAGEVAAFGLLATGSWTLNSQSSWLTFNKVNGTGNDSIFATTQSVNTSGTDRTAQLFLEDVLNNLKDTLTVVQSRPSGTIIVTPASLSLASTNGSSASFLITSDINWSITGIPSWINLSNTSGSNNNTVSVTANAANQSGSDRTATLTISGVGAVPKTVTVTQLDAGSSSFLLSVDTLFVGNSSGNVADFTVIANSSWNLSETSSWLALNKTSGTNTEIVTARAVSNNLFGSPRFTQVTASSPGNPSRTMVVAQLGAPLSFNYAPDSLIIGADSASIGKFNITSNLQNWSARATENWLSVSPTSGVLTAEITVTAKKPNNTGLPRSGSITISSVPFVPLTAKVVQDTVRSIGIKETVLEKQVNIYPNPSTGILHVQLQSDLDLSTSTIEIFDIVGKSVTYEVSSLSREHLLFNLAGLESGFYLVKINVDSQSIVKKVLLQAK
jgi:hypothetical protein